MKVAVECKSPLLQKSLELFLEKYLSTTRQCDIVVRDEECLNDERCFYISSDKNADLVKPFSKSKLILALEAKYSELHIESVESSLEEPVETKGTEEKSGPMNFEILEHRIDFLTQEYKQNILKAVKAFYEE
jgi:hypothetical protein